MTGGDTAAGTLWVVATPIGTLDDLSPRALRVLDVVGVLLAEDTRRTRALLSHHKIAARGRLRSLHVHNESALTGGVLELLVSGVSVALVSDAGTPVLSDPGFELVRAVRAAALPVASVPGPSAFTAALAVAAQPPLPATLVGFLPPRAAARRRRLADLAAAPGSLVVLLSPHRLRAELEDAAGVLGADRSATLLAELSKRHERAVVGTLGELSSSPEAEHPRGEYVLVIGPAEATAVRGVGLQAAGDRDPRQTYAQLVEDGMARSEALRETGRRHGLRRRDVYRLVALADGPESRQ